MSQKHPKPAATPEAKPPPPTQSLAGAPQPAPPKLEWPQPVNPGLRFTVRTPNRGFQDVRAGVKFQEGVGFTDDPQAAADCERFGYEVIDHGRTEGQRDEGTRGQSG